MLPISDRDIEVIARRLREQPWLRRTLVFATALKNGSADLKTNSISSSTVGDASTSDVASAGNVEAIAGVVVDLLDEIDVLEDAIGVLEGRVTALGG